MIIGGYVLVVTMNLSVGTKELTKKALVVLLLVVPGMYILFKIGLSRKETRKTVFKQLGFTFSLPLLFGILNSIAALYAYVKYITKDPATSGYLTECIVIMMAVYVAVYFCYYLISVRSYILCPMLFLSAKNSDVDKVLGLSMGRDDYITKPFSPREVDFRIKAQLRRQNYESMKDVKRKSDDVIKIGSVSINVMNSQVYKENEEVILTAKEYKILLIKKSSLRKKNVIKIKSLERNGLLIFLTTIRLRFHQYGVMLKFSQMLSIRSMKRKLRNMVKSF